MLTQYASAFIANADVDAVDDDVLLLAKRSILDGLGIAVAGARSDVHGIVMDYVQSVGNVGEASILGTPSRGAPRHSALLNGIAIHADDYDDTQLAGAPDRVYGLLTHPTAPVLPAALATVEPRQGSGADLLISYLVGVEIASKVAEAIDPRHYQDGFHSTGTAGAVGAGAASAKGLGLDEQQIARSLGLAATQAAGLRENFGSMTKPFHAGRAAEAGVVAAELVSRGMTAASTILEAPRGFFQAAGGGFDASLIDGKLGAPWVFDSPGVSIKPHPCGSLTHPAMGAMLDLVREHDLRAEDVVKVTVGTNAHMPNTLIHRQPADGLQAKFSMEFCMAILLLDGRAGLPEFTTEVVHRPDVQDLMQKVDFGTDPEIDALDYAEMTSRIRVDLASGQQVEATGVYGKGHPQNPMTEEQLTDKFLECLEWGQASSAVPGREIAERILELEKQASLADVLALLQR